MLVLTAVFACTNSKQKQQATEESVSIGVITVDELYANVDSLLNKEVTFSGTVTNVCKHTGAQCFVMGSNEDISIRVEAGEDIGTFTQEQLGSVVQIVGVLKQVITSDSTDQEQANIETKEEGQVDETVTDPDAIDEGEALEDGHELQTEDAAPVYYIEGLKVILLKAAPEVEKTEEAVKEEGGK